MVFVQNILKFVPVNCEISKTLEEVLQAVKNSFKTLTIQDACQRQSRLVQRRRARQSHLNLDSCQVKDVGQDSRVSLLTYAKSRVASHSRRRLSQGPRLTQRRMPSQSHVSFKMQVKTEPRPTHAKLKPRLRGSELKPTKCQSHERIRASD